MKFRIFISLRENTGKFFPGRMILLSVQLFVFRIHPHIMIITEQVFDFVSFSSEECNKKMRNLYFPKRKGCLNAVRIPLLHVSALIPT
jgi:hypothetical protein